MGVLVIRDAHPVLNEAQELLSNFIVGCGLIGMSLAAHHLAKGVAVRAIDPVGGAIV